MTEPEIRWIVEQLFVGNRLVKNEARIEPGRPIDLKVIRAPIIIFASHGDNITPPQQALNWIVETHPDVSEIRVRGQRIIYMTHDQIGHLGIFVSSQIANREHREVGSTLKTIEALAPGLYEMRIENVEGNGNDRRFTVGFVERTLEDIRKIDDGKSDERPFAAVARASEYQAQAYEMWMRPLLQALVSETTAEMSRAFHPQRLARALASSRNPLSAPIKQLADTVRADKHKALPDNPFLAVEQLAFQIAEQAIDFCRRAGQHSGGPRNRRRQHARKATCIYQSRGGRRACSRRHGADHSQLPVRQFNVAARFLRRRGLASGANCSESMTTAILTLNAGSSSLKFALYPPVGDVPRELVIIQPESWVPEGIHCGLSCLGTLLKRCDYNRFLCAIDNCDQL